MSVLAPGAGGLDFVLPPDLEAREPAEVRGSGRDDVRLLVAWRRDGRLRELPFAALTDVLRAGDVMVLNTSDTMPAAVPTAAPDGEPLLLHVSTRLPAGLWLVELRRPAPPGTEPFGGGEDGWHLDLPGGAAAVLLTRWAPAGLTHGGLALPAGAGAGRLWVASLRVDEPVPRWLERHGAPIRYAHAGGAWPIDAYRTVYGSERGSAEMPSAGRAFTPELLTRLLAAGVDVAPLVLHTGVSSLEGHEPPYPEWYRVDPSTARRVNSARAAGGRVVAVGTTVVRALETVADERGRVHAGEGWTDLVVTPDRGVRVVDGLLTGWHEPRASHLLLLEAVAGRPLLEASYRVALDAGFRWHELGDLHLVLP